MAPTTTSRDSRPPPPELDPFGSDQPGAPSLAHRQPRLVARPLRGLAGEDPDRGAHRWLRRQSSSPPDSPLAVAPRLPARRPGSTSPGLAAGLSPAGNPRCWLDWHRTPRRTTRAFHPRRPVLTL